MFGDVPAGTYQLQVDGETARDAVGAVTATLKVERGHASWLNWLLLQLGLMAIPLFVHWRSRAFEARRMADSDHADDDDDD